MQGRLKLRRRAQERRSQCGITRAQIRHVLETGEIIRESAGVRLKGLLNATVAANLDSDYLDSDYTFEAVFVMASGRGAVREVGPTGLGALLK